MRRPAIAAAFVLIVFLKVSAQTPSSASNIALDEKTRSQVIETTIKYLNDYYVFPEVAKQMEESVRASIRKREYDTINDSSELASKLTAQLREVSHDKHLRLVFNREVAPSSLAQRPTPDDREKQMRQLRSLNFGFERVERLDGNIGYLDLRGFLDPVIAGDTATAAMNFLANTDALIIDLRNNGGGTPAMGVLLASYLFDGDPVHYADNYARAGNTTRQWWTLPFVPGKRYGMLKPVYILTGNRTFSAAEGFTYHLKALKRVTIVGEVTGGGANLTEGRRINQHFMLFVPTGRGINPITGTNWEGVGVKPDIEVPAQQALKVAHLDALNKAMEKTEDPGRKEQLKSIIQAVQKDLDGMKEGRK